MPKVRMISAMATVALWLLICGAGVNAALIRTDLIGGLGEFEFSADTTWQMATMKGWPGGVKVATPDDSVAVGWYRLTGYGVVPEQNTVYRIEPGKGIGGSNCQYLALKGVRLDQKSTFLRMGIPVEDNKPLAAHHRDQLTFRLDRLFMSGYSLPKGAWVRYRVTVSCMVPGRPDSVVGIDLTPSATPFSAEVTAPVIPNTNYVILMVEVTAGGNIGTATPGIYVDGARIYRKPFGKSTYDMEQVPAPRSRAINTHMASYQSHIIDPYETAKDFDALILRFESEYPWALRLKYYNPSIKVYLYETGGGVTDWRDPNRVDPIYSNSPFSFNSVLAEHAKWLYSWPARYRPIAENRKPWQRDVNCIYSPEYPNCYYARMGDSDYQRHWSAAVADKVTRYRLDGVVVDEAVAIQGSPDIPVSRTEAEVQSFAHGVFPYLHQAGVQILVNCSTGILGQSPANIYFDPQWKTNSTYPSSRGYENNTPEKTPDTFFQEWAFFKHWPSNGVDMNRYSVDYWEATLANLEAVATWNISLPAGSKKSAFALAHGVDRPGDRALGLDGWAHFALCSYMLAQNRNTWFGADLVNADYLPIDMDLSGTVRLGVPTTNRSLLVSDKSLQMRVYMNGFVIVNGHPTAARTYRMLKRTIDENGRLVAAGTTISLKPHTGRIYFLK